MVLTFDGTASSNTGDQLDVDSNINMGSAGKFSICAWAKCTDVGLLEGRLFSCTNDAGDHTIAIDHDDVGNPDVLSFRINHNRYKTDTNYLAQGTLYHICVTYDKDDTGSEVRFYRDGTQYSTASASLGNVDQNSEPSAIGNSPVHSRGWSGTIEDLRLYNKVLNVSEIQAIYNGEGRDGVIDSLQEWWTLNEKSSGSPSGSGSIKNLMKGGESATPTANSPDYGESTLRL